MGKGLALIYPTHGHITPALAVVEELVRRGEEIVFYATGRSRARVEQTMARFRAYEHGHDAFNPDPPTDGLLSDMARLLALTEAMLPRLLAEVEAERPDYLLVDTKSVWGRLVGQILGLRAVTLSVVFAIEPTLVAVPDLVNWLHAGAPRERLLDGVRQLTHYAETARRLTGRYAGVRAPDIIEFLGNPQPLNIIFTSRAFQLQGDAFGDAYQFVGTSIGRDRAPDAVSTRAGDADPHADARGEVDANAGSDSDIHGDTRADVAPVAEPVRQQDAPGMMKPADAQNPENAKNLEDARNLEHARSLESVAGVEGVESVPQVYVSLGTTFNRAPEFYRACFEAFEGEPYRVLLSTGGREQPLPDAPANVEVRAFVPQLEVLARAAAFVTHGGMNSANEALQFGVPMVVVPQRGDQYLVAGRVAELGAGLTIAPRDVTPERLRDAVGRVVRDPSFRARARALGRGLEEAGGYRRAAEHILSQTAAV